MQHTLNTLPETHTTQHPALGREPDLIHKCFQRRASLTLQHESQSTDWINIKSISEQFRNLKEDENSFLEFKKMFCFSLFPVWLRGKLKQSNAKKTAKALMRNLKVVHVMLSMSNIWPDLLCKQDMGFKHSYCNMCSWTNVNHFNAANTACKNVDIFNIEMKSLMIFIT